MSTNPSPTLDPPTLDPPTLDPPAADPHSAAEAPASGGRPRQVPVAIVGVGALLPGSATAAEFWRTS